MATSPTDLQPLPEGGLEESPGNAGFFTGGSRKRRTRSSPLQPEDPRHHTTMYSISEAAAPFYKTAPDRALDMLSAVLGRDAATQPPAPNGAAVATGANASAGAPAELAYPAKVALLQGWIAVDGQREPIRAGMRVSAEIKTGDRRVIEYLLSPVVQAVKEAGRER